MTVEGPIRIVTMEQIEKVLKEVPIDEIQQEAGELWRRRGGGISNPDQQAVDWREAKARVGLRKITGKISSI